MPDDPLSANAETHDAPTSTYEEVRHPDHYQFPGGVEVLDLIEHLPFNLGSAIKYLARAGRKPGVSAQTDLDKAIFYIRREQGRLNRRRLNLSTRPPPQIPPSPAPPTAGGES